MTKEEETPKKEKFCVEFIDPQTTDFVMYRIYAYNVYFTKNDNILYIEPKENEGPPFYLNINTTRVEKIIPIDNAKIGYLE